MSGIPEEIIEQVRDAADMVSLIGEQVELKKTGADYRGPCPFHGGSNRNFAVIPRKQMFYCFVCHEAGDIFTFYMKKDGMEYPTAVRHVARAVGMEIPERPTGGPDPNQPLYDAVAVAADWFARTLRDADEAKSAREYIAQRGFPVDETPELGLGFAPRKDEIFIDAMKKLGLDNDTMLQSGLLVEREGGAIRGRFWNRLLIPIHDLRGRVVGFGGRIMGDGEPKYLNSSDNRIFHKGKILYNLNLAKQAIRKHETAIVVEGYFDVLKLAAAGIDNVVASLGTAFTVDQAKLLGRYTKEVTILYDSDRAGLKATFRAADVMLHAGLRVLVGTMPEGEDPDTLIEKGGDAAVRKVLGDALDVCERKIQLMERAGMMATVPGRRKALDKLLPTLRATRDAVTRDLYVSIAAKSLGTSREAIQAEVTRRSRATVVPAASRDGAGGGVGGGAAKRSSASSQPERTLIKVLIQSPDWRLRIGESLDGKELPPVERELVDALVVLPSEIQPGDLLRSLDGAASILLRELLGQRLIESEKIDELVEDSLTAIDARIAESKIQQLDREISLTHGEEKDAKLRDKKALLTATSRLTNRKWKL